MAAAFPAGPGQATTTSFWWWCHFLKVAEGAENEAAQRMFGFRWDVEHYCRTSLVLMMDLVLILRLSDRLWTFWIWWLCRLTRCASCWGVCPCGRPVWSSAPCPGCSWGRPCGGTRPASARLWLDSEPPEEGGKAGTEEGRDWSASVLIDTE